MLEFIHFMLAVFMIAIAGFAGMFIYNLLSETTRNEVKDFGWSVVKAITYVPVKIAELF